MAVCLKTSKSVIWRLACWRLDIRQSCESMHHDSDHRGIAAAEQADRSLLYYIVVQAIVLYIHTVTVWTTWPARLSALHGDLAGAVGCFSLATFTQVALWLCLQD